MSTGELLLAAVKHNAATQREMTALIQNDADDLPLCPQHATALLNHTRALAAAAQELENRARGVKPPKAGD